MLVMAVGDGTLPCLASRACCTAVLVSSDPAGGWSDVAWPFMLLPAVDGGVIIMIDVPSRVSPRTSSISFGGVGRPWCSVVRAAGECAVAWTRGLASPRGGMRCR